MVRIKCVWHAAFVVMICFVFVSTAQADWKIGDPYKSEYLYLPDLSTMGMDVNASYSENGRYILFDDFICSETGPITDIHLWGSWLNDIMPADDPSNVTFILSIHENNGGQPDIENYWSMIFKPGEFQVDMWQDNLQEGWMNPGYSFPGYSFPGDSVCWQYNFDIDPSVAFVQRYDERYWLNVAAIPTDDSTYWGWKTTAADTEGTGSWARWTYEMSPWDDIHEPMGNGTLLIYPEGHPYEADPDDYYNTATGVNFSFVITPEPSTMLILAIGSAVILSKRRR